MENCPIAPKKMQAVKSNSNKNDLLLQRALVLIENSFYEEADMLLSAELLFTPSDPELWLVAGLARFQRGNLRTAESAFKMSAWLNDNKLAREMLELIAAA